MDVFSTFYKALLDSSSDAICIFKVLDGTILIENYNQAYIDMGLSNVYDQKGKCIEQIYDENITVELKCKIDECITLKKSLTYIKKYSYVQKDIYLNISLLPLFIENNTLIILSCKNITEHMLSFVEEAESQSDYTCLFENSINPICLIKLDDNASPNFIKENKAFQNFKATHDVYHLTPKQEELLSMVIEQKKQINTQVCITLDASTREFYNFCLIPILHQNKVTKIFILCVNTTTKFMLPEKLYCNITNREKEILELVLDGNTNKYIAFKLKITEGTVKKVLFNCYKKLGVTSRAELLKSYIHDSVH